MFLFVCCANLYLYDNKPFGIRNYHSNEVKNQYAYSYINYRHLSSVEKRSLWSHEKMKTCDWTKEYKVPNSPLVPRVSKKITKSRILMK
jgi:hypothetical protein